MKYEQFTESIEKEIEKNAAARGKRDEGWEKS